MVIASIVLTVGDFFMFSHYLRKKPDQSELEAGKVVKGTTNPVKEN